MKNYLLLFSALVLIFSSCSSSRYGHVPKGNKHSAEIVKHPSKYSKANNKQSLALLNQKKVVTITSSTEVQLNEVDAPVIIQPKTAVKNDTKATVKANTINQNKTFVLSPPAINKILKKNGQSGLDKVQAERSWLYYLIVGVILVLIASLLVGLIGYIFYVAGVIALILAILALFGII